MATLKDIAHRAGVNISVVSRALNPIPDKNAIIAAETKQRIIHIAESLGYRRNRIAEFLKKGQSATIGIFLPNTPNRLVADLMIGISKQAAQQGFPINFFFGDTQDQFADFMNDSTNAAHSGIITYPYETSLQDKIGKTIDTYQKKGGHVIVLNAQCQHPSIPVLKIDNEAGGQIAAQHLLDKNCDCFLYEKTNMPARGSAFAKTISQNNRHPIAFEDPQTNETIAKHLDCDHQRIGIFFPTDYQAVSAIHLIQQSSRTLGKNVLLIGYDNLDLTQTIRPSLSTVHQPFKELGKRAVVKLIRMIYGKQEPNESITPWLIERQSTNGDLQ